MTKKKNVLMRSAGVLLALVLVTSCFVGSTLAKYTVSESGFDTARVAKFGVNIEANGTMFAREYDEGTTVKSVISTDKVVAPGTSGEMVRMAISGTPEVAVNVQYAATLNLNDKCRMPSATSTPSMRRAPTCPPSPPTAASWLPLSVGRGPMRAPARTP